MKKFKQIIAFAMLLVLPLATMVSCDEDDGPGAAPTVSLSAASATVAPGETTKVTVTVAAPNGAKSMVVAGATVAPVSPIAISGESASQEITVTMPASASAGTVITLVITAEDNSGLFSAPTTFVVTAGNPYTEVTAAITANTSWTKDKRYLLKGNIYVQSGATLTIEAGTKIFGDKVSKGALIISRGAKINASGTEASPIIFTSNAPAGFRNYGDWGGVVILGKAKNNQSANQTIEGISAASGDDGLYGGTDDADNSGVFKYVRVEFGGIALSTDNELNGLTLGSVGSGTELHHVQVSYSGDDSFEWFGGTVSSTYLIAYKGWDDDFDVDFGFSGNVQYAVSFRDPNVADKSGSNGFEIDNDGSGSGNAPKTSAKFANVTWFGPHVYSKLSSGAMNKGAVSANYQFGLHHRRNNDTQIYNSVFVGSQLEGVHFDKTGSAAIFKGNYFARIGVGTTTAGTVKKTTTGNGYDDANFATDNTIIANALQVDLSTIFANLTSAADITKPSALLASGSPLLTGGVTVPAGLTTTAYRGAFDATNNWITATWVNLDPLNTVY